MAHLKQSVTKNPLSGEAGGKNTSSVVRPSVTVQSQRNGRRVTDGCPAHKHLKVRSISNGQAENSCSKILRWIHRTSISCVTQGSIDSR
jgi:hypothetical protein